MWISISISRALGGAVGLANAVAMGDLSQNVEVKSNDEVGDLIKSLNAMTANLNATAAIANEVAQGNLAVEAKRLSDKDTLGLALERMIASLNASAEVANEIAREVCGHAVQLMGGYGYSREYPMERRLRDAWGWGIAGGAVDIQKVNIAGAMVGKRFDQRR